MTSSINPQVWIAPELLNDNKSVGITLVQKGKYSYRRFLEQGFGRIFVGLFVQLYAHGREISVCYENFANREMCV